MPQSSLLPEPEPNPAEPSGRSPLQQAVDAALETLAAIFYGSTFGDLTGAEKGKVTTALSRIRGGATKRTGSKPAETLRPPPTPEEIHDRVTEYRLRWADKANFTVTALASHWGECIPTPNTVLLTETPTITALIDAFRIERPADGHWPIQLAQRLRSAADRIGAEVTTDEVERRATEFRRRFPHRGFTIDAVADRWHELDAPVERVAADRTVSDFTDWTPDYDPVPEAPTAPASEPDTKDGFDEAAWYEKHVQAERRSVAMQMLAATRPAWARYATPRALSTATPPYDPALVAHLGAWVADPNDFLVLYGPTGTGKTFIACAVAHRFASNGRIPLFIRYSDLMTRIRSEWNQRSDEASIMEQVTAVDLLILDELGATGDIRDWELNYFDTLLNNRIDRGRPTVITTNLRGGASTADLEQHVGQRFASRFMLGTVLGVGGPDRRTLTNAHAAS